jgi:hypothetical protein
MRVPVDGRVSAERRKSDDRCLVPRRRKVADSPHKGIAIFPGIAMWQTTKSVASARKRFSLSRTELRNRTVHGGCRVASDRDGNNEIYVMNVDGSNLRRATNTPSREVPQPA